MAPMSAMARIAVDRIDPPHWWVGMKNSSLQLQVFGHDIRNAEVSVTAPGVTIDSVARLDGSPDWLYVYLNIDSAAKPGKIDLRFKADGKTVKYPYELRKRLETTKAQGFTQADVLYMIMPDRFADGNTANNDGKGLRNPIASDRSNPSGRHGGDLKGIADRLDYIDSLGVTAVWLNPVLENDMPYGSYHGYATTDYYRVDPRFGSNADYAALIDSLHARGIKTVMDMIFNHCGSEHIWLRNKPASDWINFPDYVMTNHRLTTVSDPYSSDYDRTLMLDGWFVREMPDLNQRNPHLMRYLVQNAKWWVEEAGIDAVRMDTYPYANDKEMGEWVAEMYREYPDFTIVGECWFDNATNESFWQTRSPLARKGWDSQLSVVMDFPLMIASKAMAPYAEETDAWHGLNTIYNHFSRDFAYADPSKVLRFLDNHDTDRVLTKADDATLDQWKQAMTILLTAPGIPQLYYGTELLMSGVKNISDGYVRLEMPGGFPGDKVNQFSRDGRTPEQNEAYDFLSHVMQWRKTSPQIADGKMKHFAPDNGLYVFTRYNDDGRVVVVLNGRDEEVEADMSRYTEIVPRGKAMIDVLTGAEVVLVPENDMVTFAPRQILILEER